MRISQSFIKELLSRIDIIDLIDSYIALRKAGHHFNACCPFHNEKTPSFTVNPEKQFYYCFGCGAHGNALSFLMEYAHLEFIDAVQELASRAGVQIVYEEGSVTVPSPQYGELFALVNQVAQYYQQQLKYTAVAQHYLKQRGINEEITNEFGLGYAPAGWDNLTKVLGTNPERQSQLLKLGLLKEHESRWRYDFFRHRLMFPIYDQRGRIIAFGGRVLDNSEPKYLNSPDTPLFQKGQELYGWHRARKTRPLERIIVVEGYVDVLALAQSGISNVVATLGTAVSKEHLTRLFRAVPEIIFCFDGDMAGQKAAWRALEIVLSLLEGGKQANFVFLAENDDPDSLVRREGANGFKEYLQKAVPLSEFLFNELKGQVNIESPDGKARFIELAKNLLIQIPTGIYRDLMLQRLTELTGASYEFLDKRLRKTTEDRAIKSSSFKKIKPSQFRELSDEDKAIVCLLNKPELSSLISRFDKLLPLNLPNINVLKELIELSQLNPKLTLASIYEHFRGTQTNEIIDKLINYEPGILIAGYSDNFVDLASEMEETKKRLYKQYDRQRIETLLQSSRWRELSDDEKRELFKLLDYKNQQMD